MKKTIWRFTMRRREMATGYIFILPWLVGFLFLFVPMFFQVIRVSFADINMLAIYGGTFEYVPRGLDHFRHALFVHPTFTREVAETIINLLWDVPLIIFFSLFMAILLNQQFPGRTLVRAIFFLPVVIAMPAVQSALDVMMNAMLGGMTDAPVDVGDDDFIFMPTVIAETLIQFGFPPNLIFFAIGAVGRLNLVLRLSGVQMLIFLAALQAIPRYLYEVAEVEGTTAYETFWKITLPMVSPIIITNVVYTVIDRFAVSPPLTMARNVAFAAGHNFGLSAVMSLVSIVAIGALLLVSCFAISRKVFYQT